MMTEEQVTKGILKWLISEYWEIICYDFPQSGTGILLHPNDTNEKNKSSINPDIVCVKDGICLFFENKDRFYHADFVKQNELIEEDDYSDSINKLLSRFEIKHIFYGIGMPVVKCSKRALEDSVLVDFIIGVKDGFEVDVIYNNTGCVL